ARCWVPRRWPARATRGWRLTRGIVTPCNFSSLRTTGCEGEWLSTTTMSAAPVRTATERRSWPTSRAVFRHWQKLTITTLRAGGGAGGASRRRGGGGVGAGGGGAGAAGGRPAARAG